MILIENSQIPVQNYYKHLIGRVLNNNQVPVDVFDNIYSAIDRNPTQIIGFSDISDRAKKELGSVEFVQFDVSTLDGPYADTFRFKRVPPQRDIATEYLSIFNSWDDSSYIKTIEAKQLKARVFAEQGFHHPLYCGWIIPEYHSLFLSSAKFTIPASDISCINYQLCSDKVIYDNIKYSHEDILKSRTGFDLVRLLLPKLGIKKAINDLC